MVLSKQDWEKSKKNNYKHSLSLASQIIDKRLNNGNMGIAVKDIKSLVEFSCQEDFLQFVCSKYRQAGWKVERDSYSDFRESWDTLNFS